MIYKKTSAILAVSAALLSQGLFAQEAANCESVAIVSPDQPASAVVKQSEDVGDMRFGGKRQFRELLLANGLKVLLMFDPDVTNATASLNVNVGSFNDPADKIGLAHYAEHAIFLGSENFPENHKMFTITKENSGSSNASTNLTETNYHFELNPSKFAEALAIFSDGLTRPCMKNDYLMKEKIKVNEEFERNRNDQFRRNFSLMRILYEPGHPFTRDGGGNSQTLEFLTRQDVADFYNQWYTANNMNLAILSPQHNLDQQQEMVLNLFSGLRPDPKGFHDHGHPQLKFDPAKKGKTFKIKGLSEEKSLVLNFSLPDVSGRRYDSPITALVNLIYSQSSTSLNAYLIEQGLIQNLYVYPWVVDGGTIVFATITLTDKGYANISAVQDAFFAYIDLFKKEAVPSYFESDYNTKAMVNAKYSSLHEGSGVVIGMTGQMLAFPEIPAMKLATDLIPYRLNQQEFSDYVAHIRPEEMITFIISGNEDLSEAENGPQKDPVYGTDFGIFPTDLSWLRDGGATIAYPFRYDAENPYTPNDFSIVPYDAKYEEPMTLMSEPGFELYFAQATKLKYPKLELDLRLQTDASLSLKETLAFDMVAQAFHAEFYDWQNLGSSYGYYSSVTPGSLPIALLINAGGFSQDALRFAKNGIEAFRDFVPDESALEIGRNQMKGIADAYGQTSVGQEMSRVMWPYLYPLETSYLPPADLLQVVFEITLEDLVQVKQKILNSPMFVTGYAFGNALPDDVKRFVKEVPAILGAPNTLAQRQAPATVNLLPVGKDLYVSSRAPAGGNGWMRWIALGEQVEGFIRAQLLGSMLSTPYFNEMRTERDIAYSVSAARSATNYQQGIRFYVESSSTDPLAIEAAHDAWMVEIVKELEAKPVEYFEQVKNSLLFYWDKENTAPGEYIGFFNAVLVRNKFSLQYQQEGSALMKSWSPETTKAKIMETLRNVTDPKAMGQITVQVWDPKSEVRYSEGKEYLPAFDASKFGANLLK